MLRKITYIVSSNQRAIFNSIKKCSTKALEVTRRRQSSSISIGGNNNKELVAEWVHSRQPNRLLHNYGW
jgi:hypothetical protein